MSANTALLDFQIAHAVKLLGLSNRIAAKIVALLDQANVELVATLAARLALIDERGYDAGPATTARINAMITELSAINSAVYARVKTEVIADLRNVATTEADLQTQTLDKALVAVNYKSNTPAPAVLEALVTESPMQGSLLEPFVDGMAQGNIDRIETAIRQGVAQSETTDQIVRRVRGTKALRYKDGTQEISRRSARTMVRTSVNHIANVAAHRTWQDNSDVLQGYQWVSVLDTRTTMICASLDGKVFQLGNGPLPPQHLNCRSTTIPLTKSWRDLGVDAEEADDGMRASLDGQVPASTTFDGWLKKQSNARQDKVLGTTRATAFRNNKLNLSDFVRDTNHVLTLDELKALHPNAF